MCKLGAWRCSELPNHHTTHVMLQAALLGARGGQLPANGGGCTRPALPGAFACWRRRGAPPRPARACGPPALSAGLHQNCAAAVQASGGRLRAGARGEALQPDALLLRYMPAGHCTACHCSCQALLSPSASVPLNTAPNHRLLTPAGAAQVAAAAAGGADSDPAGARAPPLRLTAAAARLRAGAHHVAVSVADIGSRRHRDAPTRGPAGGACGTRRTIGPRGRRAVLQLPRRRAAALRRRGCRTAVLQRAAAPGQLQGRASAAHGGGGGGGRAHLPAADSRHRGALPAVTSAGVMLCCSPCCVCVHLGCAVSVGAPLPGACPVLRTINRSGRCATHPRPKASPDCSCSRPLFPLLGPAARTAAPSPF